MNFEHNRLQTFQSWPANAAVEPQRVAKAGFFYTGEGLTVECFNCGGKLSEWEYGDQVMAKHRVLNPECPFVKKPTDSGNVPILNTGSSNFLSYQPILRQTSPTSLQSISPTSLIDSSVGNSGFHGPNSMIGDSEVKNPESVNGKASLDCELLNTSENVNRPLQDQSQSGLPMVIEGNRQSERTPVDVEIDDPALFRDEAARLETFRTWPKSSIISPRRLAKAGFYFLQVEDKVKCAFCLGVVGDWEAGDDPDGEHRRHFPSCPLHYNIPVGNIPLDASSNSSAGASQFGICDNVVVRPSLTSGIEERRAVEEHSKTLPEYSSDTMVEGIQHHRGPRHPKYSTIESRLRTFKDWPSNLRQTPDELAQAGFYYTGVHDQVRCFHCDGGLRQWDESDNPWVEHARWFSRCVYLVLMKGEDFIHQVAAQYPAVLPSDPAVDRRSSRVTEASQPSYRVRNVSELELDGLMNTEPAQMAIGVGLDVLKIRAALRQKVEQTGLPYTTSDGLIGAVLDMSSNSSSSHSPDSPSPGPSHENTEVGERASSLHNIPMENDRRQDITTEKDQDVSCGIAASQSEPSVYQVTSLERTIQVLPPKNELRNGDVKKDNSPAVLVEENRRLKEARLCKICMDEEVGVVFLPCGHLVTCINCTPSLQDCPLCRQPIKATVRTFLS